VKLHGCDLATAEAYESAHLHDFPHLRRNQLRILLGRARVYREWVERHPGRHNAITTALFVTLFVADLAILIALPWILAPDTLGAELVTALVVGVAHGWVVCSIVTVSVHEGATHDALVVGHTRYATALRWVTARACRLYYADPEYYAEGHWPHHRHLGTAQDGSFSHYVRPARLATALLPAAPALSYSDYFPWRPQKMTRSRRRSALLGKLTLGATVALVWVLHGPVVAIVGIVVVGTSVSYGLDRVRESLEHLLMPRSTRSGTRQLGLGLYGWLLGPGPWGQPCHLSHHLAPALPWYAQLLLHRDLQRTLSPTQRRALMVPPVVGVPALVWQWLRVARDAR
jgi:fatty acid desaturase